MLTNCIAECAHLTITVSQIERDIGRKSSLFHTPLHSTPPLGGFPSDQRHPVWHGKTRMAWLPDGENISKISLFVLAQLTNVTDRQTDGRTDRHRVTAIAALYIASHDARQKLRIPFSSVDRILACDGRTDGRTDRWTDIFRRHSPRQAYASRGKNCVAFRNTVRVQDLHQFQCAFQC